MSSLSPVGGFGGNAQVTGASAVPRGNPAKQLDKDLTSYLESKGVSSEKQTAIKSELSESLKQLRQSGSGVDPSKIKESIATVLNKNGLDGTEFTKSIPDPPQRGQQQGSNSVGRATSDTSSSKAGRGRPSGPPPGGPPPADQSESESSTTSSTTASSSSSWTELLESLLEQLDQSSEAESTGAKSSSVSNSSYLNRNGGNLDVQG